MELHKLEPRIATLDSTEVPVLPTCAEEVLTQPEQPGIPETPVEMVPQTPVQLVCQSPLEGSTIVAHSQIHVLLVDDNDINLKVSELRRLFSPPAPPPFQYLI
jgi:hypothetical protein